MKAILYESQFLFHYNMPYICKGKLNRKFSLLVWMWFVRSSYIFIHYYQEP